MENKTCDTCVSRYICPNKYRLCVGYNDERVFWGFLKLLLPVSETKLDHLREFIQSIQKNDNNQQEESEKDE